jgi:outer membrane protein assembly factor BamE (lipoprotein component of BamABCDE complex)
VRPLLRPLPIVVALMLGACSMPSFMSFPPQTRGNHIDASQLKELVPGTTTRADVTSLIGSPTARATFDDNQWIYITEVTKPVIAGTQAVESQHVVVLTFDDKGVLQGIEQKNQKDAQPVDVVSRTTPAPGNNATMLQQLLGNVGKFSPGGRLGGSGGGNGLTGGPSP